MNNDFGFFGKSLILFAYSEKNLEKLSTFISKLKVWNFCAKNRFHNHQMRFGHFWQKNSTFWKKYFLVVKMVDFLAIFTPCESCICTVFSKYFGTYSWYPILRRYFHFPNVLKAWIQFRFEVVFFHKRIWIDQVYLGIFMLMSVKSITDILQSIIFRPIGHALLLKLRWQNLKIVD